MTELQLGAPTGAPDLNAVPDVDAAPAPAPAPSPPPPAGWPLEAAAGIVKFPFAFLAERRLQLPILGGLGGAPHWRLSDGEAELLAPAVKYYLDLVAPAGTPFQQLMIGLAIVAGPRLAMDRAMAARPPSTPAPRPAPDVAPVPDWAPQGAPAAPVAPPADHGEQPSRAGFWAGSVPPR